MNKSEKSEKVSSSYYGSVPVYETIINDLPIMKRKNDDFFNLSQLLRLSPLPKHQQLTTLQSEIPNISMTDLDAFLVDSNVWISPRDTQKMASKLKILPLLTYILNFRDFKDYDADAEAYHYRIFLMQREALMAIYVFADFDRLQTGLRSFTGEFVANFILDNRGNTSLHWAAKCGLIKIACSLLENGADLLFLNERKETPLISAIQSYFNYDLMVFPEFLTLLKSNLYIQDYQGSTVLHHLVRKCLKRSDRIAAYYYLDQVLNFVEELESDAITSVQTSKKKKKKVVQSRCLLVNMTNIYGYTPLYEACKFKDIYCINRLLSAGASYHIRGISFENLCKKSKTVHKQILAQKMRDGVISPPEFKLLQQYTDNSYDTDDGIINSDDEDELPKKIDAVSDNFEKAKQEAIDKLTLEIQTAREEMKHLKEENEFIHHLSEQLDSLESEMRLIQKGRGPANDINRAKSQHFWKQKMAEEKILSHIDSRILLLKEKLVQFKGKNQIHSVQNIPQELTNEQTLKQTLTIEQVQSKNEEVKDKEKEKERKYEKISNEIKESKRIESSKTSQPKSRLNRILLKSESNPSLPRLVLTSKGIINPASSTLIQRQKVEE